MYFAPKPENLTADPLTPPGRKTFRNRHQCISGFVWAHSLGPCFDLCYELIKDISAKSKCWKFSHQDRAILHHRHVKDDVLKNLQILQAEFSWTWIQPCRFCLLVWNVRI